MAGTRRCWRVAVGALQRVDPPRQVQVRGRALAQLGHQPRPPRRSCASASGTSAANSSSRWAPVKSSVACFADCSSRRAWWHPGVQVVHVAQLGDLGVDRGDRVVVAVRVRLAVVVDKPRLVEHQPAALVLQRLVLAGLGAALGTQLARVGLRLGVRPFAGLKLGQRVGLRGFVAVVMGSSRSESKVAARAGAPLSLGGPARPLARVRALGGRLRRRFRNVMRPPALRAQAARPATSAEHGWRGPNRS